jgi:guanine deaminase
MDHASFLEYAADLALKNVQSGQGGPFGAVVVKNGAIIAEGVNSVTRLGDPTAHAEVMAIRAACATLGTYQLIGMTLYSSCEPCPMCLGAIYWARPEALYFAADKDDASAVGFDDSFIYQEIGHPLKKRALPTRQIHVPGELSAFEAWHIAAKKTAY